MSRLSRVARCAAALALATGVVASGAQAFAGVASAYQPRRDDRIGDGLEHESFLRHGKPREVVNVARLRKDAPFELRAIPAQDGIGDGLERTSSICRRVGCAVAVNGDFWKPGTDVPIGGVVSAGRLLRDPTGTHEQVTVSLDGTLRRGRLKLRASLVPGDLHALTIDAVNRKPQPDELVLFTPASGRKTGTGKGTVELVVRAVRPVGAITLEQTTLVRTAENGSTWGNTPIPGDGAVVAGRGRGGRLLRDLLARIRAGSTSKDVLLRIDSKGHALNSIGGSPVLVRDGEVVPRREQTSFVQGRHPRTLIGWTKKGEVLLVTVDGRQPGHSDGMTLPEAARFMKGLGATEAVNLDGGGSTTFVRNGRVMNRPSDRAVRMLGRTKIVSQPSPGQRIVGLVERPVAIALVVVRKDPKARAEARAEALASIQPQEPIDAFTPQGVDAASDPSGAVPAIVVRTGSDPAPIRAAAILLVTLAVGLASATAGHSRALRRSRRSVG